MLTGQIIFRDSDKETDDGYKLMMICGVVKVPKDFRFQGEHQYTITGCVNGNTHLQLHVDTEHDLTDKLRGMTLNGMVFSPIWRV